MSDKFFTIGEIGSTGLNRFGGYVYEEFLKELRGKRAVSVYREMSKNDPTVGALLFAIKMLIRQCEWPVEAFSEDPVDVANAEFLESCFDDMEQPWTDTIGELLSMLTYGWSYHEIVYKLRISQDTDVPFMYSKYGDGRIGWRKMPIRAQETLWRWEFDETGDLLGMMQVAPPDYKIRFIPIEKALLFRTDTTKNNPEGESILRTAYRPWYIKKHVENIEAIGVERDLAGLPIAWVPPDLLEPDAPPERKQIYEQIKKIVTNVKRDEQEGLVFPLMYDENGNKAYDLTLLSTGSRRNFDTTGIVNRYKLDILASVMADFIMLGHTKVGTFSLSSSKTELFATAIGAWMDSICETINRKAIPALFKLNGLPLDRLPKLTHGDIESQDLGELGTFIQQLSTSGASLFPNPELENYLLKQAGCPPVQFEAPTASFGAPQVDPLTGLPAAPAPDAVPRGTNPNNPEQLPGGAGNGPQQTNLEPLQTPAQTGVPQGGLP